ncbi:solid-state culture-specific ATP-grasp domain-containing protein [Colletotrichum sublineola]|nr:solid-state culture-specific ATP-grasp domain-containing protein [Colletotrichum sublineola]
MPDLPTITLDTTLADLYRRASPKNADKRIAQVLCGVNSCAELSANIPRNAKYLYQDTPFNTVPPDESCSRPEEEEQQQQQQQQLAVKYLSLIPQRDAFISGDTAVVLFHLDETDEQKAHDRREAERTISVLAEAQRPDLVFCAGPSAIPVKEAGIDMIAYKLVLDGLEGYDLVVPPDTHWFLNSKAALARSGLPTPRATIVEVDGLADEARLCCAPCTSGGDAPAAAGFVIPPACTGPRGKWFEAQRERILGALASHPLPFVLKNQQTFGGAGTYIVSTEAERDKLVADFRGGVLRRLLSSVTASNAHLRPAALVLSDLVEDPIGDYGLTFFVTDDGSDPIFLAASEQLTDDAKAWIGSTINYARQDELKRKFGPLVKKIAAWLRSHNYVGPAGADVLETAPSKTVKPETNGQTTNGQTTNGETAANGHKSNGHPTNGHTKADHAAPEEGFSHFHVVDLNIRTSGSLCLPLLRRHFTSRGLMSGSSFSISCRQGRDAFIDSFRDDLAAGRMCIVSWYEDPATGASLADVAVGAEDERGLKRAMQRVRDATEEVTF